MKKFFGKLVFVLVVLAVFSGLFSQAATASQPTGATVGFDGKQLQLSTLKIKVSGFQDWSRPDEPCFQYRYELTDDQNDLTLHQGGMDEFMTEFGCLPQVKKAWWAAWERYIPSDEEILNQQLIRDFLPRLSIELDGIRTTYNRDTLVVEKAPDDSFYLLYDDCLGPVKVISAKQKEVLCTQQPLLVELVEKAIECGSPTSIIRYYHVRDENIKGQGDTHWVEFAHRLDTIRLTYEQILSLEGQDKVFDINVVEPFTDYLTWLDFIEEDYDSDEEVRIIFEPDDFLIRVGDSAWTLSYQRIDRVFDMFPNKIACKSQKLPELSQIKETSSSYAWRCQVQARSSDIYRLGNSFAETACRVFKPIDGFGQAIGNPYKSRLAQDLFDAHQQFMAEMPLMRQATKAKIQEIITFYGFKTLEEYEQELDPVQVLAKIREIAVILTKDVYQHFHYDYVYCDERDYIPYDLQQDYETYLVLVQGRGICTSAAYALMALLDELHIPYLRLCGYNDDGSHAFVGIAGHIYDPTSGIVGKIPQDYFYKIKLDKDETLRKAYRELLIEEYGANADYDQINLDEFARVSLSKKEVKSILTQVYKRIGRSRWSDLNTNHH